MKFKFTIILLFFLSFVNAQEEILKIEDPLKGSLSVAKKSLGIFDEKSGDLAILLENSSVYAYLFDSNLKKISEIKSETLPNRYKVFLGNSISDKNYTLYFSNNRRTKFGVYNIDFNTSKATEKELSLKLDKKEDFLESLTYNNNFYLLTVTESSSIINIYKIDGEKTEKYQIDLNKKRFLGKGGAITNLYNSFLKNKKVELQKIEASNPNSIELVSSSSKLYQTSNGFRISLDISDDFTQILNINLNDYSATVENVQKPYLFRKNNLKTNSFIFDDKLLLFSANSEEMVFYIRDFKTKKVIKEYRVSETENILFKNSPIIQEGGMYDNYRELEKTKKFLRKISQGYIGISIYKPKDNYQIVLGGFVESNTGGAMPIPGFGGIPIGSIGSVAFFVNPTMFAFNSYSNTKSTYIECLFDEDFNHIEGKISDNIFDKISDFKEAHQSSINSETIFKYKNMLVLGTATKGSNVEYRLLKFTD